MEKWGAESRTFTPRESYAPRAGTVHLSDMNRDSLIASAIVYTGFVVTFVGLLFVIRPISQFGVPTRPRAMIVVGAGLLLALVGLRLPAREHRIATATTRLDDFVPVWHFAERHTLRIAAPPERVFAAIEGVRADEIVLFNAFTWIRRGGRDLPEGILNAGVDKPILDVALAGGFMRLAHDPPREIVIGTVVVGPRSGERVPRTPEMFRTTLPPGYAIATMNFHVAPDGPGASLVTTETRVFTSSIGARRGFGMYWRLIYPGSALIRVFWLRAVAARATGGA